MPNPLAFDEFVADPVARYWLPTRVLQFLRGSIPTMAFPDVIVVRVMIRSKSMIPEVNHLRLDKGNHDLPVFDKAVASSLPTSSHERTPRPELLRVGGHVNHLSRLYGPWVASGLNRNVQEHAASGAIDLSVDVEILRPSKDWYGPCIGIEHTDFSVG